MSTTTHRWLKEADQSIRSAKEGERNTKLIYAASRLGRQIANTPDVKNDIENALMGIAIGCGYDATAAKKAIDMGLKDGLARGPLQEQDNVPIAKPTENKAGNVPCYQKSVNEGEE